MTRLRGSIIVTVLLAALFALVCLMLLSDEVWASDVRVVEERIDDELFVRSERHYALEDAYRELDRYAETIQGYIDAIGIWESRRYEGSVYEYMRGKIFADKQTYNKHAKRYRRFFEMLSRYRFEGRKSVSPEKFLLYGED